MHLTSDLQHMRWMLENGADVEVENVRGKRPIHYAVSDEPVELVELLIQHGANIDAADIDGNRPLHKAVCYGLAVVRLLVKHGAKMNVQNNSGETPLHEAVKCKQSDVIMFLLKEGAYVSLTDIWRNTPLHYLTSEQRTKDGLADCIITQTKKCQHLMIRNAFGITALSHMAAHGILDYLSDRNRCCIQTLVAELKKPVYMDCNGNTPLHLAFGVYERLQVSNNAANTEFLLNRGADLNARNNDGFTPLHVATVARNTEAMMACLQRANDQSFTTVDKRGRNFWHLLFLRGVNRETVTDENDLMSIIRPMISASDSMYKVDDLNRTPLHYACMNRYTSEWKNLCKEFVDKYNKTLIGLQDKFGRTALHYAATKGNRCLMELLKSKEANDTLCYNCQMSANSCPCIDSSLLVAFSSSLLKQVTPNLIEENFDSFSVYVHQCFFDQSGITESSKAELRRHEIGASNVLSVFYECRFDYSHVYCDNCRVRTTTVQPPTMFAAIQSELDKAMGYLAKQISAKDTRFTCEIFHVGSAYEGTKVGCCDEFDYNFVLTDLSKSCNVCHSPESPPGFVLLKASTPSYDEELFNNNGVLNTRIVKFKFETLVKQVLSSFSFYENTGFEFFDSRTPDVLSFLAGPTSSKVNTNIKLAFTTPVNGCRVLHKISVDIVPALRIDNCWPEDTRKELCQPGDCLIVFAQPQNKYPWIGWTEPHGFISFARAESRLLRNCPNVIKAAFMVVKCMCKQLYLKCQFFSSHVIKTALLWCLDEDRSSSNCTSPIDNDEVNEDELLRWVQKILRRLLRFAAQDYVPSYFMPKCHQPVWLREKYLKHFHMYLLSISKWTDIQGCLQLNFKSHCAE